MTVHGVEDRRASPVSRRCFRSESHSQKGDTEVILLCLVLWVRSRTSLKEPPISVAAA